MKIRETEILVQTIQGFYVYHYSTGKNNAIHCNYVFSNKSSSDSCKMQVGDKIKAHRI